jgi:predicted TIM-barrel fold metal-dependent hydrolase
MVLDIHLEVKDDSLTRFATLLSHNSNTRIIWDHAGWCNTGLATADVISVLMAAHPNLYLSLKMRDGANAACSPTDNGNLKSEWYTLLTTYADRIMVGTDAKYWSSTYSLDTELSGSYASLDNMLKQLPADTALKIRNGTAKALFGL